MFPIVQDSKGRTYRRFPIVIADELRGSMIRRCDPATGQPLQRIRGISKKVRRILRKAGLPATKWVSAS